MWARGHLKGWLPLRRLHFLGAQLTEFADFLVPEAGPDFWWEFFQALQRWRWIEFVGHYLYETSPHLAAYQECIRSWRGACLEPYEPCWYIPIAERSWEEYLREEAGREFVVRGVRRRTALYARVDWSIEELSELSPAAVEEVVRLHALSQQRKGRQSLFAAWDWSREFLGTVLAQSAQLGWLQCFVLQIQRRWVAFLLGFSYGGVFYWWLQGFDPAYEHFAPTKVLLWHVLRAGFQQQRWREFNFMGGDTEYKRHWAKRVRQFYRLRIPNWTGLGRWLNTWRMRR
jgi:hypothetical protein